MRSASWFRASALALLVRHRVGLACIAVYLLLLVAWRLLIPAPPVAALIHGELPDIGRDVAASVVVPLTTAIIYLLAIFSFGLEGDVAGRKSLYPERLFVLPLRTSQLAAWPMIMGGVTLAMMWIVTAMIGLRPAGIHVALAWPAVFLAAFLAWTQVLMWTPFRFHGFRIALAVSLLTLVDAAVILALHFQASERLMLTLLLPQVPAAFFAATAGLRRARAGAGIGDGMVAMPRTDAIRRAAPPARDARALPAFVSPRRALLWSEWQRHGRVLPVWVAVVVPVELVLFFIPGDLSRTYILGTLAIILLTPPLLAIFVGPSYASGNEGLTQFMATRPVRTASLGSVKVLTTLRSALLAWCVVAVLLPISLAVSGTSATLLADLARLLGAAGTVRTGLLFLVVFAVVFLLTWSFLLQGMLLALSGRPWFAKVVLLLAVLSLIIFVETASWIITEPRAQTWIWDSIPLLLTLCVALKLAIAFRCAAYAIRDDQLAIVRAAGLWCMAVLTLHALMVWVMDSGLFPSYLFLLSAILIVPFTRATAGPFMLSWNRHQ